jgi:hypothetical protein
MKTMTVTLALATLALSAGLSAQAGYNWGGGGGNRGGGGGFTGELGAGGPGEAFPRLPPRPRWNPNDVTPERPNLADSKAGTAMPTSAPTSAGSRPLGVGSIPAASQGAATPSPVGVPMDFTRAEATLREIEIEWTFPVTPKAAQPLGFERAVAALAGDDRRPLLVRRHGHEVELGQERRVEALLDQEELRVLTRFFRCVDLPDTTRHEGHPLSGLYVPERAPLLFVVDADAENTAGFSGLESATEIYGALYAAIERNYAGDAERTVRSLRRGIEDYDRLLPREEELRRAVDDAVAESGPDSPAARKQQKRLDEVRREIEVLRAREAELDAALKLRSTKA